MGDSTQLLCMNTKSSSAVLVDLFWWHWVVFEQLPEGFVLTLTTISNCSEFRIPATFAQQKRAGFALINTEQRKPTFERKRIVKTVQNWNLFSVPSSNMRTLPPKHDVHCWKCSTLVLSNRNIFCHIGDFVWLQLCDLNRRGESEAPETGPFWTQPRPRYANSFGVKFWLMKSRVLIIISLPECKNHQLWCPKCILKFLMKNGGGKKDFRSLKAKAW